MTRREGTMWLAALAVVAGCSDAPTAPPSGFGLTVPSTTVALAPGEFVTLTHREAVDPIEIPDADETQAYVVAVVNASGLPGTERSLRVSVTEVASVEGAASIAPGTDRVAPSRAGPGREPLLDDWYDRGEARFRATVSRSVTAAAARASVSRAAPAVGQTLTFRSPVELDGSLATCTSTATVTAVVRAVGDRFAIVEDTAVAGQLTDAEYAAFLAEMEETVVPVSEAYFGVPGDIDGNGVVIALVTAAVNRLGAAGFFTASDLASAEGCPASNEGEILWLVGPDGAGRHGQPVPASLVRDRLVGIVAHELQHLVHAQRREARTGGDLTSTDELWLNEGLSHIAEEVTGLYAAGRRTGQNLGFEDLGLPESNAVFRTYHLGLFRFVRDYLRSTVDVPAIVDEPVSRGELRRARGFGFLFLRWAADQFASGGAPGLVGSQREEAFFRRLTVGGPGVLRSTKNVEAAVAELTGTSQSWEELFSRYAAVPAVDDVTEPEVPLAAGLRLESWNLPAAFESARDNGFDLDFPNGFPLAPRLLVLTGLPASGFGERLDLLPSTAAYFRFESPRETPRIRFRLLGPNGDPLAVDPSLQVTIVRAF